MDCRKQARIRRELAFAVWIGLFIATTLGAEPLQPDPKPSPAIQQAPIAAPIAPATATVRAMRNDASLAAVYFINPSLGWAVGDRGVIWHTSDGGATWRQQQSGVTCQLNDVFFIDERRGWAVGAECRPGGAATLGVVVRTDNGGATWTVAPRSVLPWLKGVKFFDHVRGIAFGGRASFDPSGVFTTRDGGDTWKSLSADAAGEWLAGDFLEFDVGAVAGPAGQVATLARNQVVHSPLATASLRSLRAMRLAAPTGGWAVGDGGLVMSTRDLGRSWQTPPTDLPQTISDNFDFRAVAVEGPHVWVAGAPGTRIFHSPDQGRTWESTSTEQFAPVRALTFVDAKHGWAVGDFGNILATKDGGRTWQTQRGGGQRAALLALFAEPTDVPLELLADSGAADGYIAVVNILCAPSGGEANVGGLDAAQRSRAAMLMSGAASAETAWRFPLPAADLALAPADFLAALNRENDGLAIEQLQRHFVRALRMWRPEVVVTHHDRMETSGPMAALIEQLVAQAVSAAADGAKDLELASEFGLTPWQVKKVYGVLPAGSKGDEGLASGRFSPWLGAGLSDFVAPARRLLHSEQTSPPDMYEFKLLFNTVPPKGNTRGLFGGISLAHGSDARRPQAELPTQDLEALRRLATRRRHLQELMERTEGNAVWAGQISEMIEGLGADDGGPLLARLADGYRKAGRLDLAADTYFLFARRYADHPLVDPALDWLIKFYASSEAAHRLRQSGAEPVFAGRKASERASNLAAPIQQTSATLPAATPPLSRDERLRRAAQLADYLKTARPALYAEPSVRFAETAAQRELGFANPAQRFFLTLNELPESDPWRQCASTEQWLAQPGDQPPAKKLATCRRADQPPNLDGKLDEAFWSKADRLPLRGEAAAGAGKAVRADDVVQIAYDAQYLYVAVHCPKSPGGDYRTDDATRTRDADLAQQDRVSIKLDTDRDYGTAFELTVDHRGSTHDACWRDATWNPSWYVAAASDEMTWTVEAAIPLAELVDKSPAARQVWAVAARRTIPRVGYEAWAGPATADDSPAQFGLLIFE
jgi:photosystem II stability/assembly factor-like uncharacterized protein